MKGLIIFIIKKLFIFKSLFRRDIIIDFTCLISPNTYKHVKGSKEYKTYISNSVISGDVITEKGCKIIDAHCSGNIKLGRFVSINGPATRLSSRLSGIEIGSFSSIASNVVIQEDYHRHDKISTYFMSRNIFSESINKDIYTKGKIVIEEDVWIGSNSVILSGVRIGRGSIIGAGSIVTKNIPRYSIVAGNPAKIIKMRFRDEIIENLESSRWWELSEKDLISNKENFQKDLLNHKITKLI